MKALLIVLIFAPSLLFAQNEDKLMIPVDSLAQTISYSGTVNEPQLSKDDIYILVKQWLTKQFELTHAFITQDDRDRGHLLAHATIFGQWLRGVITVNFTIACNIDIKAIDGKYRYEITDFNILDGVAGDFSPSWFSADIFLKPEHRNKKGQFTGKALKQLTSLDGYLNMIISNMKGAIHDKDNYYKAPKDF